MTNVFIFYTPLHILIADKILELEKLRNFIVIYYYEEDNAKHQYYFNKLSRKAKRSYYIKKENRILSALKTFFYLRSELKKESGPINFFAGNIKTIYTRGVIFFTGFKNLYSFDDGLGNVCGEGYLYEGRKPVFLSRILSSIEIYFTYASLIGKIKKHYTIYKLENVMPNAHYINLFGNTIVKNEAPGEESAVLLTGVFHEYRILDINEEKYLYKKIIEKFNISHVIPHPVEQRQKVEVSGVEIIRSEKIAEEILLDLKRQYKKIKVFGIYSSTLLNINGIEGIEPVNVHCNLKVSFDRMKLLFSSINIRTVNV